MKKILIIEDDLKIQRLLELELRHEGYVVDLASDGKDGMSLFSIGNYDLVLLDLMMPALSGEEVCKKIRETSNVPIIVMTAKSQVLTKVELLDMGADDFLSKPFDVRELLARMRVAFRHAKPSSDASISYDDLTLERNSNIIRVRGNEMPLTKTEYDLMNLFMINSEILLSRDKIMTEVWGYDFEGDDKILDVYINALRKKIEKEKKYINTVRGFGYMLKSKN